jgi:hypothetical protein
MGKFLKLIQIREKIYEYIFALKGLSYEIDFENVE